MSNGVRSKVGQIIFSSHRALAHVDCLSEKGHTACVLNLDWKHINCQSRYYVLPCPCEHKNLFEPFNPINFPAFYGGLEEQYYMILYVHLY